MINDSVERLALIKFNNIKSHLSSDNKISVDFEQNVANFIFLIVSSIAFNSVFITNILIVSRTNGDFIAAVRPPPPLWPPSTFLNVWNKLLRFLLDRNFVTNSLTRKSSLNSENLAIAGEPKYWIPIFVGGDQREPFQIFFKNFSADLFNSLTPLEDETSKISQILVTAIPSPRSDSSILALEWVRLQHATYQINEKDEFLNPMRVQSIQISYVLKLQLMHKRTQSIEEYQLSVAVFKSLITLVTASRCFANVRILCEERS
uniref:Uncharacterized protein n=1 Tax=Glossina pallidipes TaxID=7398 RepID=A0A1A9Z6M1_GLOPL